MDVKVVTVSFRAQVAGHTLHVTGAKIALGINAIPSIELSCAPTEKRSQSLRPNVQSPTIEGFVKLYNDLAAKAKGLKETGNVSVMLRASSGETDSIRLSGWILSAVGLSSIGATQAPYLSVILQHPICKLTKLGSVYETPKTALGKSLDIMTSSGKDFLGIVKKAYDCVRSGQYWPAPNPIVTQFRTQLGSGEFDPSKYLVSKGANIFLAVGEAAGMANRIAQAIGRAVVPNGSSTSTWDMIISTAGSLLLNVVQDEGNSFLDDKLIIEPMQPWKAQSITLSSDRCSSTDVPGMDPFRIIGVMARKLGPYSDLISLGLNRNGNENQEKPTSEAAYIPKGVSVSTSDGRIMKVSPPEILVSAFWRDAAVGDMITNANIKGLALRENNYNKIIERYCKAVYETTAGSMMHARATMALWFRDKGGKLILPGNTCKFVSNGSTIYYGYIRKVVHNLSTEGGNSTFVMMSYVRPDADFKINGQTAIAMGSKNAAYG